MGKKVGDTVCIHIEQSVYKTIETYEREIRKQINDDKFSSHHDFLKGELKAIEEFKKQ